MNRLIHLLLLASICLGAAAQTSSILPTQDALSNPIVTCLAEDAGGFTYISKIWFRCFV